MQRPKALNAIWALPFCIAPVCWRGGASGEWEGPGSEKPRVKRKNESLELPSSNQHLGEMTPAQAGPMGWRRLWEQRDRLLKLVPKSGTSWRRPRPLRKHPRNGPDRMGWRCGGSGCGEEKARSQDDAQVRGLTGKLASAAKARDTRGKPCLWRNVLRVSVIPKKPRW